MAKEYSGFSLIKLKCLEQRKSEKRCKNPLILRRKKSFFSTRKAWKSCKTKETLSTKTFSLSRAFSKVKAKTLNQSRELRNLFKIYSLHEHGAFKFYLIKTSFCLGKQTFVKLELCYNCRWKFSLLVLSLEGVMKF